MVRHRRKRFRPIFDGLDERCLLSASGLTPAQVATAYGLNGLTFGGRAANGSGQTIALVDAYNDPNIATELSVFDSAFNLPAPPSLKVVGQTGTAALPFNDSGWAVEEALDVEWAHALAPGAGIVLVEANSTSYTDMLAAVKTAASLPGVSVVSMSWGGVERRSVTSFDPIFTTSGITFVAASGDDGAAGGAEWPASSPNVLAVGGTTLLVGPDGTYQSETAWSGSSGGYSRIESEPSYQDTVQSSGMRSTPDVAFVGNPSTGVQVYSIDLNSGLGTWQTVGGTSLGAPAWAGLIAIANQGRAFNNNAGNLSSAQTLTALYSLPSSDFHVIGGGYNTQTGLGTPNGALLVNGLVSFGASTVTTGNPTPTPTTPTDPSLPVISLPIINQPVSSPTPTSPTPISPTPTSPTPTTSTVVTPPPASTPHSVQKVGKKKGGKKGVSHPKKNHHHNKVAKALSQDTISQHGSG